MLFFHKRSQEYPAMVAEYRGGATLELGGAMAPPNFFNSPLELVKKNYKLLNYM